MFGGCDGGRCRKRSVAAADDDDDGRLVRPTERRRRKTVRSMLFGACLTVHVGGHRGSGVVCGVLWQQNEG